MLNTIYIYTPIILERRQISDISKTRQRTSKLSRLSSTKCKWKKIVFLSLGWTVPQGISCNIYKVLYSIFYYFVPRRTLPYSGVFKKQQHLHPLKLEVYINSKKTFWNVNFWSSTVEKWPSFPAMSWCHYVCCWHCEWQTRASRRWPGLIGVWSLSLPPTSIWKSSARVWNIFVQWRPLSSLSTLLSVMIYKICGWYEVFMLSGFGWCHCKVER